MAENHEWYEDTEIHKPRHNRLTQDEVKEMHKIFLETSGCVSKTAKLTGNVKSTIYRYAKINGWNNQLMQRKKNINQNEEGLVAIKERMPTEKEDILEILKKLRRKLLDIIINDEQPNPDKGYLLGIAPKTLSEVIKALIDIDKRIAEKENQNSPPMLDPYHIILEKCGKLVNEAEDESEV